MPTRRDMVGVMSGTGSLQRSAADARRAWVSGGVLLIAAALFDLVIGPAAGLIPGAGLVGVVLFAAALLIFAFGIRGSGSVTARRPLGGAALTVLAGWMLLSAVLSFVAVRTSADPGALLRPFGYIDPFVRFVVTLIAVIQIARAGVVPRPWNWAPGWALAAATALWIVEALVAVTSALDNTIIQTLLVPLDELVHVGAPLFLGVLAIILAYHAGRSRTVVVYSSSTKDD